MIVTPNDVTTKKNRRLKAVALILTACMLLSAVPFSPMLKHATAVFAAPEEEYTTAREEVPTEPAKQEEPDPYEETTLRPTKKAEPETEPYEEPYEEPSERPTAVIAPTTKPYEEPVPTSEADYTEHRHVSAGVEIWDEYNGGKIFDSFHVEAEYCAECGEMIRWEEVVTSVAENPAVSITAKTTRPLYETIDGYMTSDWDWDETAQDWVEKPYRFYEVGWGDQMEYTLTLQNGESYSANSEWALRDSLVDAGLIDYDFSYGMYIDYPDQSAETPWTVGRHVCTVHFGPLSSEFEVELLPNPIKSVSVTADKEWIRGIDSYEEKEEGRSYTYFPVNLAEYLLFTISFTDGTVLSGTTNDIGETFHEKTGKWLDVWIESYQSADTPWKDGKNRCTATVCGIPAEFEVTVLPNPVKSVSVTSKKDYALGIDLRADDYGIEVSPADLELTVKLTDGTEYTGTGYQVWDSLSERFGDVNVSFGLYLERDPDTTEWTVGTYDYPLVLFEKTVSLRITIVPNPIKSISVSANKEWIRGINSRVREEDGRTFAYFSVSSWEHLNYSISFTDGTVLSGTMYEIEDLFYDKTGRWPDVWVETNQSADTPWKDGKNRCTAFVCGIPAEFEATVLPNPVKSVSVTGQKDYALGIDLRSDDEGIELDMTKLNLAITLTDGTKYTGKWEQVISSLSERFGEVNVSSRLYIQRDPDAAKWTAGTYDHPVVLFEKTVSLRITVVPNPIKSISITGKKNYALEMDFRADDEEICVNAADLDLKIKLTDGTEYAGPWYPVMDSLSERFGEFYIPSKLYVQRDPGTTEWKVGTYDCPVVLFEKTTSLRITVVPNPIKKVTAVQTKKLIDGVDNAGSGQYDYYDVLTFTVQFSDGREDYTCSYWELWSLYDCFRMTDTQEEKPWTVGKQTATLTAGSKQFPVTVTISENPVKSVTVSDVKPLNPRTDVFLWSDWENTEWRYMEGSLSFSFTVNYKDGSQKTFLYYHHGLYDGYPVDCAEINRAMRGNSGFLLPEDHTLHLTYMGAAFTVKVPVEGTASEQPEFAYVEQNGEAFICDYYGEEENVVIPDTIDGLKVAGLLTFSLDSYAYRNIRTLTIGSGVRSIEEGFFDDLYRLTSVTVSGKNPKFKSVDGILYDKEVTTLIAIPAGLFNMGEYRYQVPDSVSDIDAYLNSPNAGELVIGAGNKNFIKEDGVLYNKDKTRIIRCDQDKAGSYTMPATVESIAHAAFSGCTKLTDVSISNKVTEIVYDTFYRCTSLEKADIPTSVKSIGTRAFFGTGLKKANLSSVEEIGDSAFSQSALTEVTLSESVLSIGSYAFCATKLEKVDLPDSLQWLDDGAFCYCTKLASVEIGSGLTGIPDYCFEDCVALKAIRIPANVLWIGYGAFIRSGLREIVVENKDTQIASSAFRDCGTDVITWGGVKKTILFEMAKDPDKKIVTLPDFITSIVYMSGYNRDSMVGYRILSIPTSVRRIGSSSFHESLLTDVEGGAAYIGDALIKAKEDKSVKKIDVRAGTRIIADNAFSGSSATEVTLPEGLEIIGQYAFWDSSVKKLNIPATVTDIGVCAFAGSSLEEITVSPDNPAFTVSNGALYTKDKSELIACPAMTGGEFRMPAQTEYVWPGAFCDCNSLTGIYLVNPVYGLMDANIGEHLLDSIDWWDGSSAVVVSNPVVYVEKGSEAELAVKEACLPFQYYVNEALNILPTETIAVDEENSPRVVQGTAAQVLLDVSNGDYIADAEGKKLAANAPLATGMKLVKMTDGKVTDETEIVVPGDVDGDAQITSADARLALRRAVQLENYEESSAWYKACNVDDEVSVSAADARLILRASVQLEDMQDWIA